MPIATKVTVSAPDIFALNKGQFDLPPDVITVETYIKIQTETPNCRIFFTSNGTEPRVELEDQTHIYKAAFKLKPGRRTVKAVAVHRSSGDISVTSSKTFKVIEDPASYSSLTSDLTDESDIVTSSDPDQMAYLRSRARSPERIREIDGLFESSSRPPYSSLHQSPAGFRSVSPGRRSPVGLRSVSPGRHSPVGLRSLSPGRYGAYDRDLDGMSMVSNYFNSRATRKRIEDLSHVVRAPGDVCVPTELRQPLMTESDRLMRDLESTYELERQRRSLDRPISPTYRQSGGLPQIDPLIYEEKKRQREAQKEEERQRELQYFREQEKERELERQKAFKQQQREYMRYLLGYEDVSDLPDEESSSLYDGQVRFAEYDSLESERELLQEPELPPPPRRTRSRSPSPSSKARQAAKREQQREQRKRKEEKEKRERRRKEPEPEIACVVSDVDTATLSELEKEYAALFQRPRSPPLTSKETNERPRSPSPVTERERGSSSARESRLARFEQDSARFGQDIARFGQDTARTDLSSTEETRTERDIQRTKPKEKVVVKSKASKDDNNLKAKETKAKESKTEKKEEKKKTEQEDEKDKAGKKKKEKEEKKIKKEKKEKKKSNSSSSSSSSSSLSSSDDEKKEKKIEKKVEKTKPEKTKPEKTKLETMKLEKTKPEKTKLKEASVETPGSTPRDPESGRRAEIKDKKPKAPTQNGNKPPQTIGEQSAGQQALNFMNDSGTQINFWGAPPQEVIDRVKRMMPGPSTPQELIDSVKRMMPGPSTPQASVRQTPVTIDRVKRMIPGPCTPQASVTQTPSIQVVDDSNESKISDFFAAANQKPAKQTRQHAGQKSKMTAAKPALSSVSQIEKPASARSSKTPSVVSFGSRGEPAIAKAEQTEQKSFFSKLFKKGWGSNEKSKADPRETVNLVDQNMKPVDGGGYQKLVSKYREKKQKLFEDPDFSCTDESIFFQDKPVSGKIEWKRPSEICRDPQMFVGGASRFDVMQGVLGNCWLLASVASLTTDPKLFSRVVPKDQDFGEGYCDVCGWASRFDVMQGVLGNCWLLASVASLTTDQKLFSRVVPKDQDFGEGYCGLFRFYIWQYGQWYEVCIDDRLPTHEGKLIYMHSQSGNEFWSPLFEKAYAKLAGCYESLSGGLQAEALTDFTGGVCERYNFGEELPANMFEIMYKASRRGALMGCSIDASPGSMEQQLPNGLVIGHAYSITGVNQVQGKRGAVQLVRCRNPWGTEHEWKGAWSDQSQEWSSISQQDREHLGLRFDHDGEFWLSFRDFSANFQRMELCNLGADDVTDETDDSTNFSCQLLKGAWKKKVNAGGCRNFPKTFVSNPQYRVTLTDVDSDDEEDMCTLVVALMQKGRRHLKTLSPNLTMGYEIYNATGEPDGTLSKQFFSKNRPVATSPQYVNMREIVGRYKFPPGEYCIIPTTFEPNEESDYVIRVFTESQSGALVEADVDTCIVMAAPAPVVHSAARGEKDAEAERAFKEHGGEDAEIDAWELQALLNKVFTKDFDFGGFDLSLARSLLAMMDRDHTGRLDFTEFIELWKLLQHWKVMFQQHDADKSGQFSSMELRDALLACGYQVSNATLSALVGRYSDRAGVIKFDDFVACVVRLKSLCEIHNCGREEQNDDQRATFDLDEFIQSSLHT